VSGRSKLVVKGPSGRERTWDNVLGAKIQGGFLVIRLSKTKTHAVNERNVSEWTLGLPGEL
jgi:hypothetical protein